MRLASESELSASGASERLAISLCFDVLEVVIGRNDADSHCVLIPPAAGWSDLWAAARLDFNDPRSTIPIGLPSKSRDAQSVRNWFLSKSLQILTSV